MASISENIRVLRESKNWTKTEMAKRLGIKNYTSITKWETGINNPKTTDLKKLCKLFNVSSDYLLGISDSTESLNYYKYYPVAVSAGLLQTMDSMREEDVRWIPIEDNVMGKYANKDDIFFIDVTGNSMNKIIKPNSRIGIKKIDSFRNLKSGDIVLFGIDNEYSIKRFYIDRDAKCLIFKPESTDEHKEIVIPYNEADKVEFHGKVILSIAKFS